MNNSVDGCTETGACLAHTPIRGGEEEVRGDRTLQEGQNNLTKVSSKLEGGDGVTADTGRGSISGANNFWGEGG